MLGESDAVGLFMCMEDAFFSLADFLEMYKTWMPSV